MLKSSLNKVQCEIAMAVCEIGDLPDTGYLPELDFRILRDAK